MKSRAFRWKTRMGTIMADLPSVFWSGWIAVLTLVSLAAMVWLVWSIYFGRDAGHGPESGPVWDGNLREGNRPPPMWWFWLLFGSLIFSIVYLMLFPGLGGFPGMLNWSQGSRVAESYGEYEARFAGARAEIAAMSLAEIQNDSGLMAVAERIFRRECAVCHGPEGRGQADLFPNLFDVDWQWGGGEEQIRQSIRGGRNAVMVGWEPVLGGEGIEQVGEYVMSLAGGVGEDHPGKAAYDQNCAVCHGVDGGGNILLGASRLSDSVWLYGGDRESIRETLVNGRFGVMPAFDEQRLDDTQLQLLLALLVR